MGYAVFLLFMTLLMPAIIYASGIYFTGDSIVDINTMFGYRTKRSTVNSDTWLFANRLFGVLCKKSSKYMLAVAVISMILVIRFNLNAVHTAACIIISVQVIIVLCFIPVVENQLKQHFDEQGNAK